MRMPIIAASVLENLPREMQLHTYRITYEMEGKHWWFVGRRKIIESFVSTDSLDKALDDLTSSDEPPMLPLHLVRDAIGMELHLAREIFKDAGCNYRHTHRGL